MDIKSMLRGRTDCPCGRAHPSDIRFVEIGDNVLSSLKEICAPFSRIVLVADGNTYPLCGDSVCAILGDRLCGKQIFGCEIVIPNESSIEAIEAAMPQDTDLLIGIGSGVINDLCKHVSFAHGIRYIIIATAPSMDGYASVGAAMILQQMKVTTSARVPYAILAESDIVRTAPMDMIRSGYGDIVGKYSCLNDWKLAHLLLGEYFCNEVYDTVMEAVKCTEGTAEALLRRDRDAIRNLMEALVAVGIMMSYVGNSRPASGSEHHLSHFFEIVGLLEDKPYYLHGIDVLYSAAVTAALRARLLALRPPFSTALPEEKERKERIQRIYSSAADGVIALQEKVGFYRSLDLSLFETHWDAIIEILKEAPDYATMKGYVEAIGLRMEEFEAFYGAEKIKNAVGYAKDLKDRYTVLWLYYSLIFNHESKGKTI